jgi:hypothetical protein
MRSNRSSVFGGFRRNIFLFIVCFVVFIILFYEYYLLSSVPKEDGKPISTPTTTLRNQTISIVTTPTAIERIPTSRPVTTSFRQEATLKPSSKIKSVSKVLPDSISFAYNLDSEPAVVIVAGTDGSGTRSVVQTLTELGATMVSEDPETFDIHADLVGGWPPIVAPVLREVNSLQYTFATLSKTNQQYMKQSLQRLIAHVEEDSHKPTSYRLAVGGVLPIAKGATASKIKHGFKAPVAMTLMPLFVQLIPRCIFIHVVRDGRDIAFSVNQGPVEKFFKDYYKTNYQSLSAPIKAIRLWSDWNSDIYEFSKGYHKQLQTYQDASKSFGYYAMHTEDLINDENIPIKFNAIHHLAKFIGSSLSNERLCCLANRSSQFMGSHYRTPIEKRQSQEQKKKQVSSRYGKWKKRVEGSPGTLAELLAHGKKALKIFGYEPLRNLPQAEEVYQTKEDGFECTLTNEECKQFYPEVFSENTAVDPLSMDINAFLGNGVCKGFKGIDFKGGNEPRLQNRFFLFVVNFSFL